MDVLPQRFMEKQGFRSLQVVQLLQEGFQLVFKQLVEHLRGFVLGQRCQLLDALGEEPQLLQDLLQNLDILIVNWFLEQVI